MSGRSTYTSSSAASSHLWKIRRRDTKPSWDLHILQSLKSTPKMSQMSQVWPLGVRPPQIWLSWHNSALHLCNSAQRATLWLWKSWPGIQCRIYFCFHGTHSQLGGGGTSFELKPNYWWWFTTFCYGIEPFPVHYYISSRSYPKIIWSNKVLTWPQKVVEVRYCWPLFFSTRNTRRNRPHCNYDDGTPIIISMDCRSESYCTLQHLTPRCNVLWMYASQGSYIDIC